MPEIPDFNEKKPQVSLEKVRNITKPVVRDGEIVKDPFIEIYRHDKYKKSDITYNLRGEGKKEKLNEIVNFNEHRKEKLFDDDVEFDDCVDFLHNQINDLDI
mmetsp:Transcript_16822/g.19468  ORF Transcript_16822/g.19468 Transcript_16822/m.19468 type:complete len:102 (-) Transcript_16822:18-323(-)